eukprot:365917-Chlamydomonas_euryale.AAC.3
MHVRRKAYWQQFSMSVSMSWRKVVLSCVLRNINPKQGLVNGTRLNFRHTGPKVLQCEIASGSHWGGRCLSPAHASKLKQG